MIRLNRREFMQASTASLLLESVKVSASPGSPAMADDTAFVHTNAEGKSWTVGNALVEREIHFDPEQGLHTASWLHKVTGTDFMETASKAEKPRWRVLGLGGRRFSCGIERSCLGIHRSQDREAHAIRAITGHQVAGKNEADRRNHLLRRLRCASGRPKVDRHHQSRHISLTLSHLSFESLTIAPGPPDVLQVSGFYGSQPREIFFTGRVDDTAVLERNSLTGEGYIAMNGAPGYTKRTELVGWGDGVQLMYDTDLFPFERTLQPGETFTSAKSSIAFFADGKGFADPRWIMPSYTSQALMKKGAAYQPPWIYNTWEPFERGITKGITMDLIAAAGRMGMDVFTIDDGWQADYGDNAINLKLFPNGLDEIQAAVEQKGMRLGLWVPLAAISMKTAVAREHPEWICKDMHGKPKFTGTMEGSDAVMCLATPYREVAAKRISELIGRYHLAYVKVDLTTVFNAYGESPGCYAQGHDHSSWAESLERIYEGIQYVTDHIYRDHPDVLLDLTFELWGQKHIIDYGLLAAGDLDWLSNVDDGTPGAAGARQARTLLYLRSLAIPSETMLIGNLQAEMASIEDRLATAMGSGPLFLGDLRKLTPAQQDWYGEKIRWFKALRKDVRLMEGFFPLGNWQQPGAATWDGFARLSRQGEGMIVLFKNESHLDRVVVKLPVFPDGTFRVRSAMTGQVLGTRTGENFRQGIEIHLPPEHQVEILEIRK